MAETTSDAPRACARCGAALTAGAQTCARCLLRLGLREEPAPPEEEPLTGGLPFAGEPPSLEAVRAAFPGLEVEELLGRGGMGAVFKARQTKLERHVALKVLPKSLGASPAFAERFLREARALARLSHPGVVAVHDFGSADGYYFLVMELVDGVDLRRLLRRGALEPRQALAIARELCDALQYAHDEGVVHRDIKPENVLVDARGRVKIADFGLAKLVDSGAAAMLSRPDQVMGTPHYMAPEQLERPREVDHRADIFALGVVLYEMLTGSLPRGNFEPPSHRVQVDVRLDEIVLKALEREPERRYQQALEVKTDVDLLPEAPAPGRTELSAIAAAAARGGAARGAASPPAPRDPFCGWRALAPLAATWVLTALLWNGGPLAFLASVPVTILLVAALARGRMRADPELSAAFRALPRRQRMLRAAELSLGVGFALLLVAAGHVLHWERGGSHWWPSFDGTFGAFETWKANPWSLLQLGGIAPDGPIEPVLRMQQGYTLSSADATVLPGFGLIFAGMLLLGIAIASGMRVGAPRELRRRPWQIGAELASLSFGALFLLWIAAPIAALRAETSHQSVTVQTGSALHPDETAAKLRLLFLEEGLRVDVEQRLRIDDVRTGRPLARVWIERAQTESPFERWRTSWRGPTRVSPQIWATLVESPAGGTLVQLRAGLYASTSEEIARAWDTLAHIRRAIAEP